MVFSSNEFLFLFLPLSLILYFVTPLRFRNLSLLAVSLVFYGWGEPIFVLLMVFTVIVNYVFGALVERLAENERARRRALICAVAINLLLLGFFKYADFIVENLARIPIFSSLTPLGISLPIGISFYTFQSMSYVIDVYRGEAKAQRSIVNFGAYVSMFPQLIAGPIVRYSSIDRELDAREYSLDEAAAGARRFVCGLAKKVLLADVAGSLWEGIRDLPSGEASVALLWVGIAAYAAQIYFDFSGYSDMGIGLGKILGFHFPENFNYPYAAKSVSDFWRRWHITLSTWFKEYVYIPLGGNRCGRGRLVFNLFVTWLLTGLWHGASWNFVLWGVYYFALLAIEKLFLLRFLERLPSAIRHAYTLFFVAIGWLIFAFEDSAAGFEYLRAMFGFSGLSLVNAELGYELVRNFLFFAVLTCAATPAPKRFYEGLVSRGGKAATVSRAALDVSVVLALLLCIAYLASSSYTPFLYFRF